MSIFWGIVTVVVAAGATAFFSWVTTRGINRRAKVASDAEQDRLRVEAIMDRQAKELHRAYTRADQLEAELEHAQDEVRRLHGEPISR